MARLPGFHSRETVDAIFRLYEEREGPGRHSRRLGGSTLGKECARASWYAYRWAFPVVSFEGRMLRLFDTGHRSEERVLEDLRSVGVEIHEKDDRTGKQHEVRALGGHVVGFLDGVGRGFKEDPSVWALIEAKTHNQKGFKRLREKGLRVAEPKHYAQCQLYMGLARLERCAYISVSKNTDAIHLEWVEFDPAFFQGLLDRARRIITATEPPERISQDPIRPPCGWCDANELCHEEAVAEVNCRTCAHVTPTMEATTARGAASASRTT